MRTSAHRLVRLLIVLITIVAGKSVWAADRSPTANHVGSRQTSYKAQVEAACNDRQAADCVLQAGRQYFAPGLGSGTTRREAVIRLCVLEFKLRQPALIRAEQFRTPSDLLEPDSNLAAPRDTRLCQQTVATARREALAYVAERDREFHAARALRSARNAIAANNGRTRIREIVREYPEQARSTVVAQVAQPQAEPPPELPAPVTPRVSTRDDGLGPNLELRRADKEKAVVYARAGGQFYTVISSWLRKGYNVDWKKVYGHPGNQNKDFIGACFVDHKVELDKARMSVKSYDQTALNGPTNSAFVADCEQRGGEFRFALQGGQTFEIPAEAASSATGSASQPIAAPSSPAATAAVQPAPAASAAVGVSALALAPALSAPVPDPVTPPTASALVAEALAIDAGQDVSVEEIALTSPAPEPDVSPAMALTQDPGNRGPPDQDFGQWFSGWPVWIALTLASLILIYLLYDMRKTRIGQDVIKRVKAWRARIGLWLDERRAGTGPPTA